MSFFPELGCHFCVDQYIISYRPILARRMKARYQYRFYPTDQQQQSLARLFGCVRVVWNDALAICKQSVSEAGERTRSTKKPKSAELQKLVITQAKKTEERAWLGEVSNIPLQQSVADARDSFQEFFRFLQRKKERAQSWISQIQKAHIQSNCKTYSRWFFFERGRCLSSQDWDC